MIIHVGTQCTRLHAHVRVCLRRCLSVCFGCCFCSKRLSGTSLKSAGCSGCRSVTVSRRGLRLTYRRRRGPGRKVERKRMEAGRKRVGAALVKHQDDAISLPCRTWESAGMKVTDASPQRWWGIPMSGTTLPSPFLGPVPEPWSQMEHIHDSWSQPVSMP